MPTKLNLIGQRFGRLFVVEAQVNAPDGRCLWQCRCDCGGDAIVRSCHLRSGHTISCGCFKVESDLEKFTKHGKAGTAEYVAWQHIKKRCAPNFPNYGARGIRLCDRWQSFENFLADMGERPSRAHSIDRYPDNDGNYEPGNCRWATRQEQNNNQRRNVRIIYQGEARGTFDAIEAAQSPVTPDAVRWRIRQGWDAKTALRSPMQPGLPYSQRTEG